MIQPLAAANRLPTCLVSLYLVTALLTQTSRADFLSTFGQLFDAPNQTPHAAVVRVHAKELGTLASGSGTLVHTDQQHGYVLTNWHVVRDVENGNVMVVFPDGFESVATILKTNERWDLALLKIWRPHASPMPLSTTIPIVGEPLTIVGYGSGKYRAANGKCQHYAAPDNHSPQEMIEVSVAARQGDSGGPIVNQRGELAAVLFGSGRGVTTGTHVGRVVRFLNSVAIPESPSSESVAAERVIAPNKTQQASLVTPQDIATADNTKASTYYQLPPVEWSPVDDLTPVVAATAQSKPVQPNGPADYPRHLAPAPAAFIHQMPKQPVAQAANQATQSAMRTADAAQRWASDVAGGQRTSRTAIDLPAAHPDGTLAPAAPAPTVERQFAASTLR